MPHTAATRFSLMSSRGASSISGGRPTRGPGWTRTGVRRRRSRSIAAIGFALTAYPIGVSEGYVTREQAAERTLTTLRTLYELPQGPADTGVSGYKGFYYHFLNMDNAHRFARVEAVHGRYRRCCWPARCSARQYFDVPRRPRPGSGRTPIRCTRESTGSGPPESARCLTGLDPDSAFMPYDWRGYNEVK